MCENYTINISYHTDAFLIKMGVNPECSKTSAENELKLCDVMLLSLKIDEASCCSCEKSSRSVQWLFVKHSRVIKLKGRYGQKTRSWTTF